jgi:hypothetical protein
MSLCGSFNFGVVMCCLSLLHLDAISEVDN